MISHNILIEYSLKMWQHPSYFLCNVHVHAFLGLPWGVHEHTNRIKVHFHWFSSINNVNTHILIIHHFKIIVSKVVPRLGSGSPGLQYWTCNHILTISYAWIHHVRSLQRAKVLLISKVGVVKHIWPLDNIKFMSKMIQIVCKLSK